ncbi:hypothetical protein AB1Y20_020314 [Prymnesium parvum]|uniref:peptidylprolyl isomerase n=1 Tax=Prymnesium parvum TaxID=97485 RepID=A0AB34JWL3_PRYPA
MAAAPATAARTIFRYAHPGGGVADAGAIFDARGAMDLHVSSEGDIAELCNFVPADLPVRRPGGGGAVVSYGDMAKVIFPLLEVAPEVVDLAVGASIFHAEAWSRWWGVLQSFMAARGGRQEEYPAYMHKMLALAARATATSDAQRAALTVRPADLDATEETRPAAAGAAPPADSRGFLMQLSYGSLQSQHGLLSLARLAHGLGCHAAHRARDTTGFRRGMRVLVQLATEVTGLPAADIEPQEIAAVVATELGAIAWGIARAARSLTSPGAWERGESIRVEDRELSLAMPSVIEIREGLLTKTIKKAAPGGEKPEIGQTVQVHYTGTLLDGTQFDSSRDRGKPIEFVLGHRQVILGWDLAIETMRVGERALLQIAPEYAYGNRGAGNAIPGGATLRFDVELVGIKPVTAGVHKQFVMMIIFFGALLAYFRYQGAF